MDFIKNKYTPITVFGGSLFLSIIDFFSNSNDYTKFWGVFSNVAYVTPLLLALRKNQWGFDLIAFFFLCILIISSLYHACESYDACVIPYANLMHVDVLFSWLLLYTLASYVVFKHQYEDLILLVNTIVVVFSLEADCDVANFDCQMFKIFFMAVYIVALFYRVWKNYVQLELVDGLLTLAMLILATIFYFGGENYRQSHSLWHVIGALGAAFAITIHKKVPFSLLGLRGADYIEAREEEKVNLLRQDI